MVRLKLVYKEFKNVRDNGLLYLCANYRLQTSLGRSIFKIARRKKMRRGGQNNSEHYSLFTEDDRITKIDKKDLTPYQADKILKRTLDELNQRGFKPMYDVVIDFLKNNGKVINLGVWLTKKELDEYTPDFVTSLFKINFVEIGYGTPQKFRKMECWD